MQAEGLLSEERTRLLLSWRHSGFSVHTSVTVPPDDRDGLERLARYLLRPPVSLERLKVGEHAQTIAYAARSRPGYEPHVASGPMDPKDFLARVVMHIPDPRRHVIRYYSTYLTSRRSGWVTRRGLQDRGPKLWGPGWRLCDAVARSNLVPRNVVRARRRREAATTATAPAVALAVPVAHAPTDPQVEGGPPALGGVASPHLRGRPPGGSRCAGPMRIVAFITEPRVIHRILRHLAARGADQRSPPHRGAAAA